MALHADAVEQTLGVQILAHIINAVALVIPVLVVVVVVQVAAFRSVLSCIGESLLYEAVILVDLHPRRCAVAPAGLSGTAVIGCSLLVIGYALVADIIGIQVEIRILALDRLEHCLDVILHADIHCALIDPVTVALEEEFRHLAVPYEGMTTEAEVVIDRKVHHGCAGIERYIDGVVGIHALERCIRLGLVLALDGGAVLEDVAGDSGILDGAAVEDVTNTEIAAELILQTDVGSTGCGDLGNVFHRGDGDLVIEEVIGAVGRQRQLEFVGVGRSFVISLDFCPLAGLDLLDSDLLDRLLFGLEVKCTDLQTEGLVGVGLDLHTISIVDAAPEVETLAGGCTVRRSLSAGDCHCSRAVHANAFYGLNCYVVRRAMPAVIVAVEAVVHNFCCLHRCYLRERGNRAGHTDHRRQTC